METPKEVLEAREQYKSIDIQCLTLDDNLQPKPTLVNGDGSCNGNCFECDKFIGYWSEDGTTFSYGVYEGFCNYQN